MIHKSATVDISVLEKALNSCKELLLKYNNNEI